MAAWVRSASPSLARMLETWLFTVSSLTESVLAISRFDRPLARALSTSVSRGVSCPRGPGSLRSSRSSRAVAAGCSTLSPRAAASTESMTWSTPAVLGR
jgi:hypothetical protein